MRIVVDTNVLVSGFLNPYNPPGTLVRYIAEGKLSLYFDARILAEYREVLLRPKFGIRLAAVDVFLAQVEAEGTAVVGQLLKARLKDSSDEPFLEVAIAGNADYLITGNLKHFPRSASHRVSIMSPTDFVEVLRKSGL